MITTKNYMLAIRRVHDSLHGRSPIQPDGGEWDGEVMFEFDLDGNMLTMATGKVRAPGQAKFASYQPVGPNNRCPPLRSAAVTYDGYTRYTDYETMYLGIQFAWYAHRPSVIIATDTAVQGFQVTSGERVFVIRREESGFFREPKSDHISHLKFWCNATQTSLDFCEMSFHTSGRVHEIKWNLTDSVPWRFNDVTDFQYFMDVTYWWPVTCRQHRNGQPAVYKFKPSGPPYKISYFFHGKPHNVAAPAVLLYSRTHNRIRAREWWVNGERITSAVRRTLAESRKKPSDTLTDEEKFLLTIRHY